MALAKINRVALFRAECNTAKKSAVDLYPEYPGPFSREDNSLLFFHVLPPEWLRRQGKNKQKRS
jgi:hypothetical protein